MSPPDDSAKKISDSTRADRRVRTEATDTGTETLEERYSMACSEQKISSTTEADQGKVRAVCIRSAEGYFTEGKTYELTLNPLAPTWCTVVDDGRTQHNIAAGRFEAIPAERAAPVPATEHVTKTSGERRVFATGSVRDKREGKGRYDLLPAYPIRRLARLYERGAANYGDRNWEKGQPLSGYIECAGRHFFDFLDGDRSEDHLTACVWNIFAFLATERWIRRGKLPKELDDMGETDLPDPDPTGR